MPLILLRGQRVCPLSFMLVLTSHCWRWKNLDNQRFSFKPAAVVYPKSPQDVSEVIKIGASHHLRVVARSGGVSHRYISYLRRTLGLTRYGLQHSYIANGLGGRNGSLVVDMKNLSKVSINSGTAVIETGNRLGDVATALANNGKAIPHGTCAYVGIGGHAGQVIALFRIVAIVLTRSPGYGGFGFTSRMWGLTLDTIIAVNLVLADGTITRVTQQNNADLFWVPMFLFDRRIIIQIVDLTGIAGFRAVVWHRHLLRSQNFPGTPVHYYFSVFMEPEPNCSGSRDFCIPEIRSNRYTLSIRCRDRSRKGFDIRNSLLCSLRRVVRELTGPGFYLISLLASNAPEAKHQHQKGFLHSRCYWACWWFSRYQIRFWFPRYVLRQVPYDTCEVTHVRDRNTSLYTLPCRDRLLV